MTAGQRVLKKLKRGERIAERIVIVTAHPDDETVSMGGALCLMDDVVIIQLTDGAMDDPRSIANMGVSSRSEVAALRRSEREAAFRVAGWDIRVREMGFIDQETALHLNQAVYQVAASLGQADVVFAHPYEGGHIDHDSVAAVVQRVCECIDDPPTRLEFASYHWDGTTRKAGVFWPVEGHPAVLGLIRGERLARKQAAVAAYKSQASVTRWFNLDLEQYRTAPTYDFTKPPTTPACWYDRRAWKTTSAQWRAAARAALLPRVVSA